MYSNISMNSMNPKSILREVSLHHPDAVALLRGSEEYPDLIGLARFYQREEGVLLLVEAEDLPQEAEKPCQPGFFALHIHEGSSCDHNSAPFIHAGGHFNPGNCPHPAHAGDLPPLLSAGGRAILATLTNRFTVAQILGRTLIVHRQPDDFATQPAGNSGDRIACGVICTHLPALG